MRQTPEEYGKQAKELFLNGYNCAQAVICAFAEEIGLDEYTLRRLGSSFGGGMGRLREVCGAVSGMFVVLGLLCGYEEVGDHEAKAAHYEKVQELARRFEAENGSIICRELLGLTQKHSEPEPEKRTPDYYKKRPCPDKVESAARILAGYLEELSF